MLFTTANNLLLLTGCFVAGLEYSADAMAEVVGKPEKAFFNAALTHLNSIISSAKEIPMLQKEGITLFWLLVSITFFIG